jgi:hypothetical protein
MDFSARRSKETFSLTVGSAHRSIVREQKREAVKSRPLFDLCTKYGPSKCEDRRDIVYWFRVFTSGSCREANGVD